MARGDSGVRRGGVSSMSWAHSPPSSNQRRRLTLLVQGGASDQALGWVFSAPSLPDSARAGGCVRQGTLAIGVREG